MKSPITFPWLTGAELTCEHLRKLHNMPEITPESPPEPRQIPQHSQETRLLRTQSIHP